MKGLTKQQHQILHFIQNFISLQGYSPSYREIMHHFGLRSIASVSRYIQLLKKKGHLDFDRYSSRSIKPFETHLEKDHLHSELNLSLIGTITFGKPLEIFSNPQSVAVPRILISNFENSYVIRARGEGFQEALIFDGDLLIVEGTQNASSGDVVLATTGQKEIYVKKYYPEGQYIRLDSISMKSPPIIVPYEEVLIQGIVSSLLRLF